MHVYENIKKLLYYKYGEPHTKSGIYSLDNPRHHQPKNF